MSASPPLPTAHDAASAPRQSSSPTSTSSASSNGARPANPTGATIVQASTIQNVAGSMASAGHPCMWENCTHRAVDPELLYIHLCNDHIGRKSTGNLCLTCKWKDCGVSCAKRDHITSHLRVHTPLKPHTCEICSKAFKRPQDLKKHEKIHTAEHHNAHKHSKAQLAPGSALFPGGHPGGYSPHSSASLSPEVGIGGTPPRADGGMPSVRRSPPQAQGHSPFAFSMPSPITNMPTSTFLAVPPGVPLSHSPSLSPHSPGLLTPTNLSPYPVHQQNNGYAVPPPHLTATAMRSGYDADRENKRLGDGLEDFFNDAKRRRYAGVHDNGNGPMYDDSMAARLNDLSPGFLQSHQQQQNQQLGGFAHAMNTAVQSDTDLAHLNGALLQLHKAISGPNGFDSHGFSHGSDALLSDQELAALGLAGMPGINMNSYGDANANGYTVHGQYAMPAPAHQPASRYAPPMHSQHHSNSSIHTSLQQQYNYSSYPQLVPQLGPSDMGGMSNIRTQRIPKLKEAPMSPNAMDVEERMSRSPSPPVRVSRRVWEDPNLKLPAISTTTSPTETRPSTSASRALSPIRTALPPIASLDISETDRRLPTRLYPRLPPLSSILSPSSPSSSSPTVTPVQAQPSALSRPSSERTRHAKLVKDLLVMVNREWVRRQERDVDMSS